ncbi:response regulator [Candidatus Uhrbacteria bacterium]|nr:response regulator [Candidatus Uhrbacteria bacterium]
MTMKKRILLVDDEDEILSLYGEVLAEEGFEVLIAHDGAEGVKVAKQEKPDLVLMDLKMPVMDGMDAFMQIHDDPATRAIKVVFLTAFGDPEVVGADIKISEEIGAAGYIRKGITLDELVKKVREYIR